MDLSRDELAVLRCLAKTATQRMADLRVALDLPAEKVPGHVAPRNCPRARLVELGLVRELSYRKVPGSLLATTADGRAVRLEITASGRRVVHASLIDL
jgi:hypothetical protein